jgi:hypothetical protein
MYLIIKALITSEVWGANYKLKSIKNEDPGIGVGG